MDGPFRQGDAAIRYLCPLCYQTGSSIEGRCPTCGGEPLQHIDSNQRIIDGLRRRAREKKRLLLHKRYRWVQLITVMLTLPIVIFIGSRDPLWIGHPHVHGSKDRGHGLYVPIYIVITIAVFLLVDFAQQVLTQSKQHPATERFDPNTADIPTLLSWVGPDRIL
jgi:hypothetical protein